MRGIIFLLIIFLTPTIIFADTELSYENILNNGKKYYTNQITTYYSFVILQEKHGNKLREKEQVRLFVRKKPYGEYIQFMKGKYEGLRVSYLPTRDGNSYFTAKETGIRGIISVKTWGFHSFIKKILYPHIFEISQYNMDFMIKEIIRVYQLTKKENKLTVKYLIKEFDNLFERVMIKTEVDLDVIKSREFPYKKVFIIIDPETFLPLYIRLYDYDGSVLAYYYFKIFKKNIRIDNSIFNLHNKPPVPPVTETIKE